MSVAPLPTLTLQEFFQLPYIDESPAWEYRHGAVNQKPMGGSKHSLLQKKLVAAIDGAASRYEAFPELRCTFGGHSVVPDITVIASDRVPLDDNEEIASTGIDFAPDWVIEILSPNQSQTRVTGNILYCLQHGSQVGWLLDPEEKSVLCYLPDRLPQLLQQNEPIPCPLGIDLELSANSVYQWLRRDQ